MRPDDPLTPWKKPSSGNLFAVAGEGATTLPLSDEWNDTQHGRELAKGVKRIAAAQTPSVCNIDLPSQFPSVSAAASLLARLHTPGTTVLAAWDPLGVFSAAAEKMGEHCIAFLGMKADVKMTTIYPKGDFPILKTERPVLSPGVTRFLYSSTRGGKAPMKLGGGSGTDITLAAKPQASAIKRPRSPMSSSTNGKGKKKKASEGGSGR